MNKISKKIVSLVTMAAFAVTLVPAAAFAADRSSVEFASDKTLTLKADEAVEATIDLHIGADDATKAPIYVWLTKDNSNEIFRYVDFTGDYQKDASSDGELANAAVVTIADQGTANTAKDVTITAEISDPGDYTVHAGIGYNPGTKDNRGQLQSIETGDVATITVKAATTSVNKIEVPGATVTQSGGSINYDGIPNGIRSTKVEATVSSVYADGTTPASSDGKILTVTNPYSNLTILNADGEETNEIVVDGNTATFYVKADTSSRNTTYQLTLTADNVTYRLSIVVSTTDNTAATIEAVDTGVSAVEKPAAGSWYSLEDVAQFTVKNANGDVLIPQMSGSTPVGPEGFDAFTANDSTGQMNENVGIIAKPDDCNPVFKVVAGDENKDIFTLKVVDNSELVAGKYTVRVSLDNGKSADVTFTVANFGTVQDTIIEVTNDQGNVVNEVVDGGKYTATAYEVDENGLKRPVAASMGVKGSAATQVNTDTAGEVTFVVKDDKTYNDDAYIGSKIGVYAFTTPYDDWAYAEVTVVDPANVDNYTLAFDPTNGAAGEDNTVKVTVVDEDGDKVNISGEIYVTLVDSSVEDANVYVNKKVNVTEGEGSITINSDKETELEIIVGVMYEKENVSQNDKENIVIANTLNYTVGKEDPNADTTVVMTIGSTDYVVNNDILTGDAAPYVDSAWRTMVPFRVLGETFGATVNWDQDAQTVTYTLGDTELTMTIGEETYTVNGDEKTMDTAPVLSGDRTYVPVRFVAEALGYTVVPLQDAETGLTASVVFQK